MEKKRCASCFRSFEGDLCPHCGGAQNEEHQLPVGTLLRDRYALGQVLGQGGFGITYIAWDALLQKCVAVKEFFPSGTVFRRSLQSTAVECSSRSMVPHYEYSRERFLREASALVQFQGIPEVVGIQDFLKENNTAYIVMEYVRGVDLAKYIRRKGGRLSVDETFRILRPVMEALAKIHKAGIIHRDISPDNIILDPMGGAKLLDFGAVRVVEDPDVDKDLSKSTEAILKLGFAPLEQYNTRGSLGPWTDGYAMCATVWYCLTGKVPEEATVRVTEGIDPDWSAIADLPEHQRRALEKGFSCLAKDRYRSMDALLEALFPREEAPKPAEKPEKQPEKKPDGKPAKRAAERPLKEPEDKPGKASRERPRLLRYLLPAAVVAAAAVLILTVLLLPKRPADRATAGLRQSGQTGPAAMHPGEEAQRYLLAEQLLEEGKLGEAAIAFGKLAGYSDARERSLQIWDQIAVRDPVAAGSAFALGLKTDGTVVAAGSDHAGRCDVEEWSDIIAVAAGGDHSLGLKADGTVVATGDNEYGQCDVESWSGIVAIATYYDHSLGLRADGTVVAVGQDQYGQCDVEGWSDIVAIAAGGDHSLGLKADGTVVATGDNEYGQCDVESWSDIVAISAGSLHSLGLKADGTVVAEGYNGNDRCNVEDWSDIVAISTGWFHSVGSKADGTTVAVGSNEYGQCDVESWSGIVTVAAGSQYSLGLRADGTVVAVGRNDYGLHGIKGWSGILLPGERLPFR